MIIDDLKDFVERMWFKFRHLSDLNKFLVIGVVAVVLYLSFVYYKKNIENMEGEGGVLRFFYADWCPHCKDAKPHWNSLKSNYKGNVTLKSVDCTKNTDEAQKFNVEGFPTFILTKNGKNIEYEGERTTKGLLNFLNSN